MEGKGMEIMTFGISMVVGDAGTIFFVAYKVSTIFDKNWLCAS